LRRLAAQEATPPPLHLVAATPGRLRALLDLNEAPLNMKLGNNFSEVWKKNSNSFWIF